MTQRISGEIATDSPAESYYMSTKLMENTTFDSIISQINTVIQSSSAEPMQTMEVPTVNTIHQERGSTVSKDTTIASSASRLNAGALESMESFIKKNEKAIRRLSHMPNPSQLLDLQEAVAKKDRPKVFQLLDIKTAISLDPYVLSACDNQMITARMRLMALGKLDSKPQPTYDNSDLSRHSSIAPAKAEEVEELLTSENQYLVTFSKTFPGHESIPSSASGTSVGSRRSSFSANSVADTITESTVSHGTPMRQSVASIVPQLKLDGLNRRSRTESVSSRQSFISASSAMGLRRNRSVSNTRRASKGWSVDHGHTREQSAGRLLALKLGALTDRRRSITQSF
jgi:hypothetical protein